MLQGRVAKLLDRCTPHAASLAPGLHGRICSETFAKVCRGHARSILTVPTGLLQVYLPKKSPCGFLNTKRPLHMHTIKANRDIPYNHVRVVDDYGLVGDFSLHVANNLAKRRGKDLVLVSADVNPPLCRLVHVSTYSAELDQEEALRMSEQRKQELREFSFDPAMKVKGMRFSANIGEHDLERKINKVRKFIRDGHRVDAVVQQGRCVPDDVVDLGLRVCAEIRDIAKPENLEESIRQVRSTLSTPKSYKRRHRARPMEMKLRLWPCTESQAKAFALPANVLGPRRRRGPFIVGVDDEEDEDDWMYNRRPQARNVRQDEKELEYLDSFEDHSR